MLFIEYLGDSRFLGSKITADGDCSHEIKRPMLLGRKAMTNLQKKKKKVRIIKAMVFPVVTYRYEHQRIDAFELWC